MAIIDSLILILFIPNITHSIAYFHEKVYSDFTKVWPCISRSNGTHAVGCSSAWYGNVGIIQFIFDEFDLQWVLQSSPMSSYVVIMDFKFITTEKLEVLNNSSKIQGILLIPTDERFRTAANSPEYKCPNQYFVLNGTCREDDPPWNSGGEGLMWRKWNLPMFYTDDSQVVGEMYNCYRNYNLPLNSTQSERSLCALQMTSFMHSRGLDSETCLRRQQTPYGINKVEFCEKLGDFNIIVPLISFESFAKKKYIVLAVRLDSASFFHGRAPAVLSTVTSLITLMLAAKLLNELTRGENFHDYEKNVLFAFFNGEAFDFIGSGRVVYDMTEGTFPNRKHPVSLKDIILYVELSQIAVFDLNEGAKLYNHNPNKSPAVLQFLEDFNSTMAALEYKFEFTESMRQLTPLSIQSFLKHDATFPGIVLSSFNEIFRNKFYHSILDSRFNIESNYNDTRDFISDLATTLAYTVYKQITGKSMSKSEVVNKTETNELLKCYDSSIYCDLFRELKFSVHGSEAYPNFFIGKEFVKNPWFVITKNLLIHYTSREIPEIKSKEDCTNPKMRDPNTSYKVWDNRNKTCRVTNVGTTLAVSPAFEIKNYDMKSFKYSTWSESTWRETRIRLFRTPTAEYEWQAVLFGGLILYFSFVFVYFVAMNARKLFSQPNSGRKKR